MYSQIIKLFGKNVLVYSVNISTILFYLMFYLKDILNLGHNVSISCKPSFPKINTPIKRFLRNEIFLLAN